jgi:hypothetical protein
MSELQALQQRLLQAVLADKSPRLRDLQSDALAGAGSRLAIYRNGYRARLRDALASEFAGLALMTGKRFATLLDGYVSTHPSGHYNIRWYGAGLSAYLEYGLPWREKPEMAEMAQLDWAISTAFDALDEPVSTAENLAGLATYDWEFLRLRMQDPLQILSVHHNVDAFRRAADLGHGRPRLRHADRAYHVLVWRQSLAVHYRQVENDELSALTGAIKNEPFARLCERLVEYHEPAAALPRMVSLLHQWLGNGLITGWTAEKSGSPRAGSADG